MTLQRRLDEERMVGFEQGIEQGVEQEKKNSVISFYSAGVPIDVIVTATNLSKEEVQSILAENDKQD